MSLMLGEALRHEEQALQYLIANPNLKTNPDLTKLQYL